MSQWLEFMNLSLEFSTVILRWAVLAPHAGPIGRSVAPVAAFRIIAHRAAVSCRTFWGDATLISRRSLMVACAAPQHAGAKPATFPGVISETLQLSRGSGAQLSDKMTKPVCTIARTLKRLGVPPRDLEGGAQTWERLLQRAISFQIARCSVFAGCYRSLAW